MKKGQCLAAGFRVNGIPIHSRRVYAYLWRLCSSRSAACVQKCVVPDTTRVDREFCVSNVRSKILCVGGQRHRQIVSPGHDFYRNGDLFQAFR